MKVMKAMKPMKAVLRLSAASRKKLLRLNAQLRSEVRALEAEQAALLARNRALKQAAADRLLAVQVAADEAHKKRRNAATAAMHAEVAALHAAQPGPGKGKGKGKGKD